MPQCPICDRPCATSRALAAHRRTAHADAVACDLCGRELAAAQLGLHRGSSDCRSRALRWDPAAEPPARANEDVQCRDPAAARAGLRAGDLVRVVKKEAEQTLGTSEQRLVLKHVRAHSAAATYDLHPGIGMQLVAVQASVAGAARATRPSSVTEHAGCGPHLDRARRQCVARAQC
eukprot:gene11536-66219_t